MILKKGVLGGGGLPAALVARLASKWEAELQHPMLVRFGVRAVEVIGKAGNSFPTLG